MTEAVRVLVVDDHPIVLDGVTLALQNTSWLRVAGYARCGRDAITAVESLRPDTPLWRIAEEIEAAAAAARR